MSPRGLLVCALIALGCQTPREPAGFGSISTMTAAPEGTGGAFSTSSGDPGAGSSSTTTGVEESSGGSSTGPRLDLGVGPDLDSPQPVGCKGKIDFLFVISSGQFVEDMQDQLIDAFPKFIETIQSKFADFDYHILVTDGGASWWGNEICNDACPMTPEPGCVEYPCDKLDLVGVCETTWGAGDVFNAGYNTMNKPCNVAEGRRYLTRDQPALAETFECIARVGGTGGEVLGHALVKAVSPELNELGGCNEGFLREDALLVVTLASPTPDANSPGTPAEWAQAVVKAKFGDPSAIVAFRIGYPRPADGCYELDRVCQVTDLFPYSHWISFDETDYGPGFDAATDLVETACGAFIPQ